MPRRISLVVSGGVLGDPQNNPGEFWFYELAGIFVREGVEWTDRPHEKHGGSAAATVYRLSRPHEHPVSRVRANHRRPRLLGGEAAAQGEMSMRLGGQARAAHRVVASASPQPACASV